MKNLFSVSTENFFENLYNIDRKDPKQIDKLYSEVIDQIPLYIDQRQLKLLHDPNTSINSLADICIDICTPYFKFNIPKKTCHGLSPWVQLYGYTSTKRLSDADFKNEETFFKNNVKRFLIYSFLYRHSQQKTPLILKDLVKTPFDLEKLNINSISSKLKKLNHLEQICSSKNKSIPLKKFRYFDYRSKMNTLPLSKDYLDFFINYTPFLEGRSRKSFKIKSYLDIMIFLGLIYTTKESSNPFLLPYFKENEQSYFYDAHEFLSYFSKLIPASTFDSVNDFSFAFNNYTKLYSYNEYSPDASNHFLDIHDILTEKITNINLINAIYKNRRELLDTYNLHDALYDLAGYPLLYYRIHLIDEFQKIFIDNSFSLNSTENLTKTASRIFRHQIYCTFPILDIIFNIFLLKAGFFDKPINLDKNSIFKNSTPAFFSYEKDSFNKNFIMLPALSPLAKKASSTDELREYSSIASNIYNTFGTFIIRGAQKPIIETTKSLLLNAQKNCYKDYQQHLSKEFNNLRCKQIVVAPTNFVITDT